MIDSGASGVSGDKYLGALLDLGASLVTLKKVARAVQTVLPLVDSVDVSASNTERADVGAKLVKVETVEKVSQREAGKVRDAVQATSTKLGLSEWGVAFSLATVDTLMHAEAKIHRHAPRETVLHELGSADTILDILGTAAMVEELGLIDALWVSTPLAVGGGLAKFSGKTYPNPAPAVIEILRSHRFPIRRGDELTELTTPTGAAITVNLAKRATDAYPGLTPVSIGYGAGSKELSRTANILRITVGEKVSNGHNHDTVVILETNLDDVTGEVIGHAVETLFSEGARDVTVTPVYMKKNRPGNQITIIADETSAEKLASILMEETGTLGVREIPVRRHIENRNVGKDVVRLNGKHYSFRLKRAYDQRGHLVRQKPEYEDLKKISLRSGVSLREIASLLESQDRRGHGREN